MHVVQLMASPFFGGPERQMLGLSMVLPSSYRTTFLTFAEKGSCRQLLNEVRRHGLEGIELKHNFPEVRLAIQEVAAQLRRLGADVVCCSGYKPDVIGWMASRRAGVPAVSVSHGWTSATMKVRFYETLDRVSLRWMDAVVCVSEGQAVKVKRTGAQPKSVHVIRNAVSLERFDYPDPKYRDELHGLFRVPRSRIVCAAGRLSPEKGFDKLVEAAAQVVKKDAEVGFVIFGEGPLRARLTNLIAKHNLTDVVVMPGFRTDLENVLPHADMAVLSSYTEGLPVILLEAMAARLPVVATAVGGVPEVVEEGITGHLVQPGDATALGRNLQALLGNHDKRRMMGQRGREQVEKHFTFPAQSIQYQQLFERLVRKR